MNRLLIVFIFSLTLIPAHLGTTWAQDSAPETTKNIPEEEMLLLEASVIYNKGQKEEAIGLLEKSIKINPNFSDGYYRLGIIYADSGDYERAIEYFKKSIELNPNLKNAYLNLGAAYGYLKDYNQALKYLDKALTLDKQNPRIYYNIGITFLAAGDGERGAFFISRAKELALQKNDAVILEKIKNLYSKQ